MSSRSRIVVLLISTPFVALVIVGGLLGAARPAPQRGVPHLRVFSDVVSHILGAYVEEVNVDKVMDGAMRGLADGLDPATAYLTPAEVKAIDANTPLGPADVGLTVSRQFYLRVLGVRDGSPAKRAGLATGDFVRAINDTPTRDMSAFTGSRLLRGPAGSKVTLLVIRGNTADPHQVTLVREVASGPSVTSRRLAGGPGYVRVLGFEADTVAALRTAIQSVAAPPAGASRTPGDAGVIIDLRGTADGAPELGVAAARLFIKTGTLLATRVGRIQSEKQVIVAGPGDGAIAVPVVLMVSNGTANAAEVFAAALAGAKRGTLVGEPTAGLAATQKLVRLPEGHGLWLTTERFLQADGSTPIHERGLRPDVPIEGPTVAWEEAPPAVDATLGRAIEELKKEELKKQGAPAPPPAA